MTSSLFSVTSYPFLVTTCPFSDHLLRCRIGIGVRAKIYPIAAHWPLDAVAPLQLGPPDYDVDVLRGQRGPLPDLAEVDLVVGAVLGVDLPLPRRDLDLEGGLLVRHQGRPPDGSQVGVPRLDRREGLHRQLRFVSPLAPQLEEGPLHGAFEASLVYELGQ